MLDSVVTVFVLNLNSYTKHLHREDNLLLIASKNTLVIYFAKPLWYSWRLHCWAQDKLQSWRCPVQPPFNYTGIIMITYLGHECSLRGLKRMPWLHAGCDCVVMCRLVSDWARMELLSLRTFPNKEIYITSIHLITDGRSVGESLVFIFHCSPFHLSIYYRLLH